MIDIMSRVFADRKLAYRVASGAALLFMAVFMLAFASRQSFWVDELDWTIGFITGKAVIRDVLIDGHGLLRSLLEYGYNLPLYYLIMVPVYHLAPYGEVWLLIPSIVFVILGIVFLKRAGTLLGGDDMGFITLCVAVTSSILMTQGGWEFRPYAITFCFSSVVLWRYIARRKNESNSNIVVYGICLALFLYCHWFSAILALFFAFFDLFLWLRKKIAFKCIVSYIIAGGAFVPWFVLMLTHHVNDLGTYWGEAARLSIIRLVQTVYYLLSGNAVYCMVFGFSCCFITVQWLSGFRKKQDVPLHKNICAVWIPMILSIMWTMIPVFVYSKFINPAGAMYEERYFFVIIPQVFLLVSYGFVRILYTYSPHSRKFMIRILIAAIFCFSAFQGYRKSFTQISALYEPYRQAAFSITADERVYAENALVLTTSGSTWLEYYCRKRGVDLPYNAALTQRVSLDAFGNIKTIDGGNLVYIRYGEYSTPTPFTNKDLLNYDRLYVFEVHGFFPDGLLEFINDNYVMEAHILEPAPVVQNPVKQTIKRFLRMPTATPRVPSGLWVYSKKAGA